MSSPASIPAPASRPSPGVVLLPAGKFFVRRIALVAGQDVASQAALTLETIGPFAPAQLYHGCLAAPDGTEALVFAAYRRNFSTDETAAWADAEAVLPVFAFWAGQPAPTAAEVWLHEHEGSLAAIYWDGRGKVPAGVLARESAGQPVATLGEELVQEARRRLDGAAVKVRTFPGVPEAGPLTKQGLGLTLGGQTTSFTPVQLGVADVRDKAELATQSQRRTRDRRLWQVFAAAVIALGICVAAEGGLAVSRFLLGRQRARLEAVADKVRQIEQANQLVVRMEQLAGQSLRPLEMLALLNAVRPATLEFVRAATISPRQMEIEAQSGNAADPQAYQQALAGAVGIEQVELRELRTSGGRTTFLVAVTFKPGFAGPGGVR